MKHSDELRLFEKREGKRRIASAGMFNKLYSLITETLIHSLVTTIEIPS